MISKASKEKLLKAAGFTPFHGVYTMYKSVWRDLKTGRLYTNYNDRRFYYEIGVVKVAKTDPEHVGQCAAGIHVSTIRFALGFRSSTLKDYVGSSCHLYVKAERVLIACQFHIDDVVWAGNRNYFTVPSTNHSECKWVPHKSYTLDKIRVKRVLPIGFVEGHAPKMKLVEKYAPHA